MNHIVDTSPLTKSEGGMDLLREADDDAAGIYSDRSTRETENNTTGGSHGP